MGMCSIMLYQSLILLIFIQCETSLTRVTQHIVTTRSLSLSLSHIILYQDTVITTKHAFLHTLQNLSIAWSKFKVSYMHLTLSTWTQWYSFSHSLWHNLFYEPIVRKPSDFLLLTSSIPCVTWILCLNGRNANGHRFCVSCTTILTI